MSERYDAVVIGAGPAGEVAVSRLNDQGLRVALAERELIGGECAYWACIPSKTLLSPPEARVHARRSAGVAEPTQRWGEIADYRDYMIRNLDDAKVARRYEEKGVSVYKGEAKIAGPGGVTVGDETLQTERIVVATGSDPKIPPVEGLEQAGYWTNREATTLSEVPGSAVILGGGPVGVELGQLLRRYGCAVTIVEPADRLLPGEDPAVGESIAGFLQEDGVELRLDQQAAAVSVRGGQRVVHLNEGGEIAAEQLVVAVGRAPRVRGLGLETVGIEPTEHGIAVDERCRAADGVWAIGDVTGIMPFTHVGMYQGRIVCDDIAGREARADYTAIPRVVFSDPEVAAVGLREEQARQEGIEVVTARVNLPDALARPWTYEQHPRGELELVADRAREVLVGACVGRSAACRRVDPPGGARDKDRDPAQGAARHGGAVPYLQRGLPEGGGAPRRVTTGQR